MKKEGSSLQMILEIKYPCAVNSCRNTYMRLASPVFHTWKWKQIAISEDKTALQNLANNLPISIFYDRERNFRIVE